jgi:predicted RNase H-like nuclease (RuvC/YqgF family)
MESGKIGRTRVSNEVLQHHITELSVHLEHVSSDLCSIKEQLKSLDQRLRSIENQNSSSHPVLEIQISELQKHNIQVEKRLDILERSLLRLESSNRILTVIGGVLGTTTVTWLITQVLNMIGR